MMRTIGNVVMGVVLLAALSGVVAAAEARSRAGCGCVLLLAGAWIGAGLVRDGEEG